jgi:hypothetical protein
MALTSPSWWRPNDVVGPLSLGAVQPLIKSQTRRQLPFADEWHPQRRSQLTDFEYLYERVFKESPCSLNSKELHHFVAMILLHGLLTLPSPLEYAWPLSQIRQLVEGTTYGSP